MFWILLQVCRDVELFQFVYSYVHRHLSVFMTLSWEGADAKNKIMSASTPSVLRREFNNTFIPPHSATIERERLLGLFDLLIG